MKFLREVNILKLPNISVGFICGLFESIVRLGILVFLFRCLTFENDSVCEMIGNIWFVLNLIAVLVLSLPKCSSLHRFISDLIIIIPVIIHTTFQAINHILLIYKIIHGGSHNQFNKSLKLMYSHSCICPMLSAFIYIFLWHDPIFNQVILEEFSLNILFGMSIIWLILLCIIVSCYCGSCFSPISLFLMKFKHSAKCGCIDIKQQQPKVHIILIMNIYTVPVIISLEKFPEHFIILILMYNLSFAQERFLSIQTQPYKLKEKTVEQNSLDPKNCSCVKEKLDAFIERQKYTLYILMISTVFLSLIIEIEYWELYEMKKHAEVILNIACASVILSCSIQMWRHKKFAGDIFIIIFFAWLIVI
ncbi:uncharacterized protein LOC116337094 isoform X2 [Contarinia nasturtii]|uniref:uncharacterized protein LOC116337094 isoform X2 n=1 Tax=Contarinia nasturtii TaxID=265458 RepID=UPI0012D4420B|nr:uncharacterized protein LOC116337094 isoform X2 [Contarinia nasturtii]